ncbi:MAG: hypothetical protein CMM01_16365 [Rhodopirellula sp.]|nr:hypothetical protein [Rhodopirellula sp.]
MSATGRLLSLDLQNEDLKMSDHPPNQPSPYAAAPEAGGSGSKSGGGFVLIIGLVVGVVFMLVACGGLAGALLLPAVSNARLAAQQMSERNNMRMVGLALHNYHSAHKQLPCAVATDVDGRVISTWRMALVPFLKGGVPVPARPAPVAAPVPLRPIGGVSTTETNVFAILSPNGMFSSTPNARVRFSDVSDGLRWTVMAIKLPNRSAEWSSTKNMTPDEAFGAIQSIKKPEAAFWLMGDGAVSRIALPLDRKTFDAFITRGGGEPRQ